MCAGGTTNIGCCQVEIVKKEGPVNTSRDTREKRDFVKVEPCREGITNRYR